MVGDAKGLDWSVTKRLEEVVSGWAARQIYSIPLLPSRHGNAELEPGNLRRPLQWLAGAAGVTMDTMSVEMTYGVYQRPASESGEGTESDGLCSFFVTFPTVTVLTGALVLGIEFTVLGKRSFLLLHMWNYLFNLTCC